MVKCFVCVSLAAAPAAAAKSCRAVPVGSRQTLLFSATAIHGNSQNPSFAALTGVFDKKAKNNKKAKLRGTLKGIGQNKTLPDHLKQ
jgi:hypothetical protein